MQRQKSFQPEDVSLYLVATPIGNLSEMTPRAISVLTQVDLIAAEDTRVTRKLLAAFDIHTPLVSHHKHAEKASAAKIIASLQEGKSVALVSDAGYPLISDPGSYLVNAVLEKGFPVIPISGSSALLSALVASGLSTSRFLFLGFVDPKVLEKELLRVLTFTETLILYEAPHRIEKTVLKCLKILGNRKVCLAREITKKFEEFYRGTLMELAGELSGIKGEMVLVIEGASERLAPTITQQQILASVNTYISAGMSTKAALKKASEELGISRNEAYRRYHELC
ncbi:MAG: 16S rRNA (cytidine(1402)-2'-O)-methyltransferase [Erysipelotrichaceae bacterium]|jgi:16S rRNA (cytidine1402-2'-O)-methyltransferase|nr:16S rRNA (cytidine(1402)-2'-O)-methyltransferase [Erysipelotrichaceae bacterium]